MQNEERRDPDAYLLPRDEGEKQRLTAQHSYLKRVVWDGKVVYDNTIVLGPDARVLDSATGTGIWALEVAEQLPKTVEIHAIDLSSNNFPPKAPSNVYFSIASITSLPEDWANSFDFINQRLLFAALLREQWPVVLTELFKVLKPGGAVQLLELDTFHPVPESTSTVVSHYRDLQEKTFSHSGLMNDVTWKIRDMLLTAGFTDVKLERRGTPVGKMWGEIGMQGTASYGGAMRKLTPWFLKAGTAQSAEEYEEMMDKLQREWDEQGTQYHGAIFCARKPIP